MLVEGSKSGEGKISSGTPLLAPVGRYHPDVLIFLILIPVISGINYYLTYSNIAFNWFFIITFCIDTIQGYAAWWAVRSIIHYLDKVLTFEERFGQRILVQVITTLSAGLFIIAGLTEITSFVAKGKAAPLEFYSLDLVIIGIWFFVINGIYVALYYVNLWRQTQQEKDANLQPLAKAPAIVARVGRETIRVDPEHLSGLFVDDDYVVAVTATGKKHYLDQSLDKLERVLVPTDFFRINRQYILSRKVISGFRRLDNGKLAVLLYENEGLPSEVTMSRTRAAEFKGWFKVAE